MHWSDSIFKAEDEDDPGNYRGITVVGILSKLYAMVLEAEQQPGLSRADPEPGGRLVSGRIFAQLISCLLSAPHSSKQHM